MFGANKNSYSAQNVTLNDDSAKTTTQSSSAIGNQINTGSASANPVVESVPATSGLFGSARPTTTTAGGLFGTQNSSQSGGLFGQNPSGLFGNSPTTSGGGLFGQSQPASRTTSLFGNPSSATTTLPLGAGQSLNINLFTTPHNVQPNVHPGFSFGTSADNTNQSVYPSNSYLCGGSGLNYVGQRSAPPFGQVNGVPTNASPFSSTDTGGSQYHHGFGAAFSENYGPMQPPPAMTPFVPAQHATGAPVLQNYGPVRPSPAMTPFSTATQGTSSHMVSKLFSGMNDNLCCTSLTKPDICSKHNSPRPGCGAWGCSSTLPCLKCRPASCMQRQFHDAAKKTISFEPYLESDPNNTSCVYQSYNLLYPNISPEEARMTHYLHAFKLGECTCTDKNHDGKPTATETSTNQIVLLQAQAAKKDEEIAAQKLQIEKLQGEVERLKLVAHEKQVVPRGKTSTSAVAATMLATKPVSMEDRLKALEEDMLKLQMKEDSFQTMKKDVEFLMEEAHEKWDEHFTDMVAKKAASIVKESKARKVEGKQQDLKAVEVRKEEQTLEKTSEGVRIEQSASSSPVDVLTPATTATKGLLDDDEDDW